MTQRAQAARRTECGDLTSAPREALSGAPRDGGSLGEQVQWPFGQSVAELLPAQLRPAVGRLCCGRHRRVGSPSPWLSVVEIQW